MNDRTQSTPRSESTEYGIGPDVSGVFDEKLKHAAWETTPACYIMTKQARMLPPELLRATAERMKANTTELDASHVPQASQPEAIAAVTTSAATTGGAE